MNLDDRLRAAQRRQVDVVDAHLRATGLDRSPLNDPSDGGSGFGAAPWRRWALGFAVAVSVGLVGLVLVPDLLGSSPNLLVTIGDGDSTPIPATESPATEPPPSDSLPSDSLPSDSLPSDSPDTTEAEATLDVATSTKAPRTSVTTGRSPSTPSTQTTTGSAPTVTDEGVASEVCPTGFRAALEQAETVYLSEETGWGRKNDLIDEQDETYYFAAWEPNYPGRVEVEVVLAAPVLATELRVAQDPITEVGGVIEARAGDDDIRFELSGLGGWQVHEFAEPTMLDRFTLTRTSPESNLVEVMVCVVAP